MPNAAAIVKLTMTVHMSARRTPETDPDFWLTVSLHSPLRVRPSAHPNAS